MISFKYKINFKNFRTTFLVLMLVFPWIALEASQEDQSKQNDSVKSFPLFQNTGDLDLKTNIFSFLDLRDLVSISANKSFREIIKSEGFLTATDLKISLPNDTCKAFYSLTYDDILDF